MYKLSVLTRIDIVCINNVNALYILGLYWSKLSAVLEQGICYVLFIIRVYDAEIAQIIVLIVLILYILLSRLQTPTKICLL